jgi:hypothetical protein
VGFALTTRNIITINVPVDFMARYVMILRGATSLRGAMEGVGPEKSRLFWALKWHEMAWYIMKYWYVM